MTRTLIRFANICRLYQPGKVICKKIWSIQLFNGSGFQLKFNRGYNYVKARFAGCQQECILEGLFIAPCCKRYIMESFWTIT